MEPGKEKSLPWLLLVACAFIWGASFILIKKGLEAFDPEQVATLRIIFAFLVMLPFALYKIKVYLKDYWKKFLFLGLIANLLPAFLFATAQMEIKSSLSGILNSLTPIFTLIIGVLFFKGKLKLGQAFGLIVGLIGSIELIFINERGGLGDFNSYALLIIVATLCYGISANYVKANLAHIHSITLTSFAMFFIGPISIIILLTTDFFDRMNTVPEAWASLGYLFILGAVGTALALVLFNRLIQLTSAVFASSVTYLIPIMAVFWGIVDGERLFLLHFVGMGLIIAGVYIINKTK
jgi:drug/metabolite transporter (DMT)-like permease